MLLSVSMSDIVPSSTVRLRINQLLKNKNSLLGKQPQARTPTSLLAFYYYSQEHGSHKSDAPTSLPTCYSRCEYLHRDLDFVLPLRILTL